MPRFLPARRPRLQRLEGPPLLTPTEVYELAARDVVRAIIIFASVYGFATLLKYCG